MQKICHVCRSQNDPNAYACRRCSAAFARNSVEGSQSSVADGRYYRRFGVLVLVCLSVLAGFYLSLIGSASKLGIRDREKIDTAIEVLDAKGFSKEVFLLRHLTAYRASDNWLNASVAKENAYAATNFPFEIMTVYPDFFSYPIDDTERAAILLHEAKHLQGAKEREAYEFVWKNREKLGWTRDKYHTSPVWDNIRNQTREHVPELFTCATNDFFDCTETNKR